MSAGLPSQTDPTGSDASEGGALFIPNLCSPHAVLFMVLLTELIVMVHVLASSSLRGFDWPLLAGGSMLAQWIVLLSGALLCWLREPLSGFSLPIATILCLIIISLVTALSSYLGQTLLAPLTEVPRQVSWIVRNVVIANVLGGIVLRYFSLQQQLQIQQRAELQARLDSLRARIHPHFLFNTLNSIASLIETRPERAEQAVEDLAELFRASLKDSNNPTTVADELHLVDLYLAIEKLRLGGRLEVTREIQPDCLPVAMPSLLLQPLVENAVYHGVAAIPAGGEIAIRIWWENHCLHARIENPTPIKAPASEGNQVGLANVELRLKAMFGASATLVASHAAGRFVAELRYPTKKSD
ncbi:hypothetical protein A3709_03560 [Halioglobus sp. HI00S01]|uniref:sensor histidine kinase n=1 Tax=Halioglobus sp. HI00S01 TaxID=1822214 RepID=UPI0007C3D67F|nr:histidine kinase [Halioglobus sp. HI00S01]KZX56868.1 hypothetical protein A3709_03560 [Halioglobus sp. HI00S01]